MKYIKEEFELIKKRDPSIKSIFEVFLYPSFKAKLYYKISNKLYRKKHYFLARYVSEKLKKKTGIEIHPGATIGKNLFIDHGVGIVIGETAVIGDNVTIYQGATLGTTGKVIENRHPIVGDNVIIGAGAIILGDVEENSTVVGVKAKKVIK